VLPLRRMIPGCLAAIFLLALPLPAVAQDYPARKVRLIVPFAPGGPTDVSARQLGMLLSDALKQEFFVDNIVGANSIIGTQEAQKAAPDGYTLLVVSNTHTTLQWLFTKPKPSFTLQGDFVAVASLASSELVMIVTPNFPVTTFLEFRDLALLHPKQLNYGSGGPGSLNHLAFEYLKVLTQMDLVHVPYRSIPGARLDLLNGQLHAMFDALSTALPLIRAGQVKPLGTTGQKRSALLNGQVPAIDEFIPGYTVTAWNGIMAPKGTPPAIVEKLNSEINKVLDRPETKHMWAEQGSAPLVMSTEQFRNFVATETDKWRDVVQISRLRIE
jgi:tripartite-type tricarboxylate transporter receptor subunit TctC